MKLPEKNPAEKIFRQFCESYAARDMDGALALFKSDANVWGSGIDEYRKGLAEIKLQLMRDWAQSEYAAIEIEHFIPVPPQSLWAAAICRATIKIDGNEHVFDHLRGTIVIEKVNGEFKISHMHASFPDYRNAEAGSFPEV